MKRLLTLCCVLALLCTSMGCSTKTKPPKKPVTFYYLTQDTICDGKTEIIQPEERESAGYESNMEALLNIYLQGPRSISLRSPFPAHLTVTRYATTGSTAILTLSTELSYLSGIDLTLACVCIANTLFDLTELSRVQIFAADAQLEGQSSITLERDDVYWIDTPPLDVTEPNPS